MHTVSSEATALNGIPWWLGKAAGVGAAKAPLLAQPGCAPAASGAAAISVAAASLHAHKWHGQRLSCTLLTVPPRMLSQLCI